MLEFILAGLGTGRLTWGGRLRCRGGVAECTLYKVPARPVVEPDWIIAPEVNVLAQAEK